ncbi:HTH-type transcriptional repressor RspR [Methylobacterium crusticola]|uniref:HTH-type transcriptional repressor RspR n=1 Tax=Methylobacterium crusticola TaxID=1697972 RepID=A0ABQ4R6H5_9HYPH|nr:GntR family transcriptional regulator [Methylobacterium crusticola]GJD53027.1 HTH-type transcriptional repressor RspR [Methylobacterium crusticola]
MLAGALAALEPPVLVRQQAFETIRDAIVDGRLAPGTRLVERELCQALGISRASVREVIRRLEAERLVSVAPRRGPTVMTLSAKEAAEIYEVRAMLESLLIRRFTAVASEAEVEGLCAIFAEVRRAAAAEAVPEIVGLMLRFNAHLVAVADHALARDLLAQLNARINWLRVRAMAVPGRIAASIEELSAVLAAVRARDAETAARLIAESVGRARDAALRQLAEAPPPRERRR